jgi:hypothetical protein
MIIAFEMELSQHGVTTELLTRQRRLTNIMVTTVSTSAAGVSKQMICLRIKIYETRESNWAPAIHERR